ncbi:uncharacterized protein [Nothobranchius furzeri]|uniref:uncharacterized protein n=1 Tax=Nothobranchius furzeri TaxID=105023 RepID=UPI003904BC0C
MSPFLSLSSPVPCALLSTLRLLCVSLTGASVTVSSAFWMCDLVAEVSSTWSSGRVMARNIDSGSRGHGSMTPLSSGISSWPAPPPPPPPPPLLGRRVASLEGGVLSWSEVFPCCHSLSFEFSLCRWACLEVTKLQQICSSAGQGYLSSWETPTLRWMITLPGSTSTFIPDWLFLWNSTCLSLSCSLARTTSSCPPKLPGSPPTQLPPRLPFWISVSGIPSQPRPDHSSLELLFPLSRLFPARAPFVTELSYVQAAPLVSF